MPGIKKIHDRKQVRSILPKSQFKSHAEYKILVIIYSDPEKKSHTKIRFKSTKNQIELKSKSNKTKTSKKSIGHNTSYWFAQRVCRGQSFPIQPYTLHCFSPRSLSLSSRVVKVGLSLVYPPGWRRKSLVLPVKGWLVAGWVTHAGEIGIDWVVKPIHELKKNILYLASMHQSKISNFSAGNP